MVGFYFFAFLMLTVGLKVVELANRVQ